MSIVSVEELINAGVHFGHPASSWNPKMKPFIFGKRNLIHIINIRETLRGLIRAYHFLHEISLTGEDVLVVGTKRQSRQIVEEMGKNLQIPYVSERWLGGMLTNYTTIRERLTRLEEIERMEETGMIKTFSKKMISSLLREKRKIQRNLDGVRRMERMPGALVVVDPKREYISVKEAYKLNIPVVAIIDTDSDPDLIDIAIPGNDDAYRSISTILRVLGNAIEAGKKKYDARMDIVRKEQAEMAAKETAAKETAAKEAAAQEGGAKEESKDKSKSSRRRTSKTRSVPRTPSKGEDSKTQKKPANDVAKEEPEKAAKAEEPKKEETKEAAKEETKKTDRVKTKTIKKIKVKSAEKDESKDSKEASAD